MTDYIELQYNFTIYDYAIVVAVLGITAIIGFYYVWKAQRSKNTREFLVANKSLGLTPLILSAAATALSSGTLLGTPMEAYCNGVQLVVSSLAFVTGSAIAAFTTVPVLYKLNVSTTNQYIEYRFNRFLRVVPASVSILQNSFLIASITYVTALVLTQATGLHLWLSIALIAGLCIVYSSLGGFIAVIWTDVFQMIVIIVSYITMVVMGTMEGGGFGKIWEQNRLGDRTTFFHWTASPISNYTAWSILIGNFTLGFLITATSQSSLQRQLATKNIAGARKTVIGTVIISKFLSTCSVWIGMSVYAKYHDCDPYLSGRVSSRDQVAASFAMDIFSHIPGLSGLYVGGILCATLSTLSSVVNAFAAITLIDFIKPLMPKISDANSKLISKIIGGLYGLLVFGLCNVAQNFGGIIQTMQAIGGTSLGSTAAVYTLGFFIPWANAKGTTVGYVCSLAFGWWLSISRMVIGNPYVTAPMSIEGCLPNDTIAGRSHSNGSTFFGLAPGEYPSLGMSDPFNDTLIYPTSFTPAEPVIIEDSISLIQGIIPLWFSCITVGVGVIVGTAASLIIGVGEVENLDPNLISPLTKRLIRMLPKSMCQKLRVAHFLSREKKFVAPDDDFKDPPNETEEGLLKNGTEMVTIAVNTTNGAMKTNGTG